MPQKLICFFVCVVAAVAQTSDIRIHGPESARSIRVTLTDAELEVFDSGLVQGASVIWNRQDREGRTVPDGVYSAVIEFQDPSGLVSRVLDTLLVSSQAAVDGTGTVNFIPKFTGASMLGNSLMKQGSLGIGVNLAPARQPDAVLHVADPAVLPASRAEGFNATDALIVQGSSGGATQTACYKGGHGANVTISGGSGGPAPSGATGGDGGNITLNPGFAGCCNSGAEDGNVLLAPMRG